MALPLGEGLREAGEGQCEAGEQRCACVGCPFGSKIWDWRVDVRAIRHLQLPEAYYRLDGGFEAVALEMLTGKPAISFQLSLSGTGTHLSVRAHWNDMWGVLG